LDEAADNKQELSIFSIFGKKKIRQRYYPDQQMHTIYINNILYFVIIATCFDATASSSGTLIFYVVKGPQIISVTNSTKTGDLIDFCNFNKKQDLDPLKMTQIHRNI
jgi:hypothetical protein